MINYLMETTLFWTGAYLLYFFFLRRQTYHALNRWYLLLSLITGAILPLLNIRPAANASAAFYFDPITISSNGIVSDPQAGAMLPGLSVGNILLIIYLAGLLFFALKLFLGLGKLSTLFFQNKKFKKEGFTLIKTNRNHPPFSFFKLIFIGKNEEPDSSVLRHELAHVKGKHTFDVLLIQLIAIVQWFNPLVWLLSRAIKTTHEYLADQYVLQFSRKKEYSYILLQYAGSGFRSRLTSNFHSQTKKRIKMIFKKKSSTAAFAFFPLSVLFILGFGLLLSCNETVQEEKNIVEPEAQLMVEDNKIYEQAEVMPLFPGCATLETPEEKNKCTQKNIIDYLYGNIKYPEEARKNGISGMVVVKFVINTKGNLVDPEIIRSVGSGCDEEVLRNIREIQKLEGKWTPGFEGGKAVNISFTLPVKFKLDDDDKKEK